jgi:hypothetical protein
MSRIAINALVGSAMVAVSLVGASAQTKPTADAGTPVTAVGCLKKWDPAIFGRGGIQNPAKLDYVLSDLGPGTAAAPAQPNVLRYLVKAKDSTVTLSAHVNHRVELTGTVTGLSETQPTATPQVVPTLTVASLKMVATECI